MAFIRTTETEEKIAYTDPKILIEQREYAKSMAEKAIYVLYIGVASNSDCKKSFLYVSKSRIGSCKDESSYVTR